MIAATMLCLTTPLRAETVLFTGATVHTVSGETFLPGQLLVKDGKIAAVGAKLDARADKTIDLAGLHLFPGLIAAATSLGLTEISAVRATQDTTEVGGFTPDVQAWIAVNPDSELLPVARAGGITHFLALPLGGPVSGQSGLMGMTGWSTTERTVKAPIALHVFWPGMGLNTTPRENLEDKSKHKSLDEQAKDRQKKLKELDDFFEDARAYAKARASGAPKAQPDAAFNPAWEAMLAPVRGEIPLMIHADDARQIKAAVQWTKQRGYQMILAGGRDAWQVAALLASNSIPVLYESEFDQPARDHDSYEVHYAAPAKLHQAGVKVVFSPGPGARAATFARNLPHAAAQAVAFGLPEAEALKGITLYPAQVLGVADRLGSLEAGKDATFIAVDGNILDVRTNVRRMWIGGQETPLDSRHTRLYEKYKGRPKP
ncbi:MAG: amidohydrolase family protein [Verrucomicrobia bacterium]|nr:amidohydrolase family protein [Verrucomicrobiota bacterium]